MMRSLSVHVMCRYQIEDEQYWFLIVCRWIERWDRSNNMTLNLWKKQLSGSTISGNEMSFSGKMFSFNIEKEDTGYWGSWDGKHEVITIPDDLTILEAEQCNTSDFLEIPFIGGEFYVILEVVEDQTTDGIVDIEMTMSSCNVTQCPVNSYSNGTRADSQSKRPLTA